MRDLLRDDRDTAADDRVASEGHEVINAAPQPRGVGDDGGIGVRITVRVEGPRLRPTRCSWITTHEAPGRRTLGRALWMDFRWAR